MTERVDRASERLLSIGIDIGTTTTQVVLSDLTLSTPTYNGAKSVEILDRHVRHCSQIHRTTYTEMGTIDTNAVVERIDQEIRTAGITDGTIDTGAVIATGEAARTENAEPLVKQLSERLGDFVVATAGASLEAVLAGHGSGAAERSREKGSTIATIDIGGGTTNMAVFEQGEVRETRCVDIGGRLVQFDDAGAIASVSDPARWFFRDDGHRIEPGVHLPESMWRTVTARMADHLFDCLNGPPYDRTTNTLAITALPEEPVSPDEVVFTGGVGRLVSDPEIGREDPFKYNDLGVLLGEAVRNHEQFDHLSVQRSDEDIRATVIGTGTRTTTFTGRTIAPDEELLPQKNVPVVAVGELTAFESVDAIREHVGEIIRAAMNDREIKSVFVLYVADVGPLTYDRLRIVTRGITAAYDEQFNEWQPLIVLTRQNCAKVLGQLFESTVGERSVMVFDELAVTEEEYVDFGTPLRSNTAVPVTIKTLIFDE
jgi:ethanolamine utilization protein EutA